MGSGERGIGWHGRLQLVWLREASFLKNRIGLCVLHPIKECAGQACRVDHVDSRVTNGRFPRYISPHQPFKEIRSISHEVVDGVGVAVIFDGETFEMEDQRNWTDASFKTYCTPLDLPFPVRVQAGDRIRQSVKVWLHADDRGFADTPRFCKSTTRVKVDWSSSRPLPAIGLGMATTGHSLTPAACDAITSLRPAHLRVDLRLQSNDWREQLQQANELAHHCDSTLHAALFVGDSADDELIRVLEEVKRLDSPVGLWLLLPATGKVTDPSCVELASGSRTLRPGDSLRRRDQCLFR